MTFLTARYVIANDLVPSAVDHIRKNVEWNGLGSKTVEEHEAIHGVAVTNKEKNELEQAKLGKVRPNQGDALHVSGLIHIMRVDG